MEKIWDRDRVIETLENLAMSCGRYGRLLAYLEDISIVDPDKYEEIINGLVECGGPVEMIISLEA